MLRVVTGRNAGTRTPRGARSFLMPGAGPWAEGCSGGEEGSIAKDGESPGDRVSLVGTEDGSEE